MEPSTAAKRQVECRRVDWRFGRVALCQYHHGALVREAGTVPICAWSTICASHIRSGVCGSDTGVEVLSSICM